MTWLAILVSVLSMTAIVALRYLASSGLFAWISARRIPGIHAKLGKQMRREIGWSLVSAAIFGIPAGLVAWGWQERGWTRLYEDWSAYPLWYAPVSVFLYLFAPTLGSIGRIAGCIARRCFARCTRSTMPAARRPPGRR